MIIARGLTKQFSAKGRKVLAVSDLDLDVARGEMVAFLGPNGAGKSTSLRMLTTLLPPTSGTAIVAGCDVLTDPAGVRARIGYVGQGNSAGHYQRVRDELLSQGAFYGMSTRESGWRADELLASLHLADLAKRNVITLSGGQRRRLDVAMGLVHRPQLLFLDEPTTGLDPQSRANLWEHINRLREQHGTTIFFSTHYLDEADQYAERVMVMDRGRVIANNTSRRLKSELAGDRIELTFPAASQAVASEPLLRRLDGVNGVDKSGTAAVTVHVTDAGALLPVVLRELDANGTAPCRALTYQPTLDDVFLNLTGRSLREEGEVNDDQAAKEVQTSGDGRSAGAPSQTVDLPEEVRS
jgi:ABC-2 type transport system ATP-binding protein